jgi:hypothetical protein
MNHSRWGVPSQPVRSAGATSDNTGQPHSTQQTIKHTRRATSSRTSTRLTSPSIRRHDRRGPRPSSPTTADRMTTDRHHNMVISSEARSATRSAVAPTATTHTPATDQRTSPPTHITASSTSTTHHLSPALPLPTQNPNPDPIAKRDWGWGFVWAGAGRVRGTHGPENPVQNPVQKAVSCAGF